MVVASLLTTVLLLQALAVAAQPTVVKNPLISLPFAKRFSTSAGSQSLVKQDQLRIKSLKARAEGFTSLEARITTSPADNRAVSYIASVGVGSPSTQYDLVIDTGSSNTWVGANTKYVETSTSKKTSNSVSVTYGTGNFNGTEYTDQVTITSDLVIQEQSIGVASSATGFNGVDGILGVGPTGLTVGTLSPDTQNSIPTVTDNLFTSGAIAEHSLSVSFEPITDSSGQQQNGELIWGGVDSTKFTGEISYAAITGSSPANTFWGFDSSISYGGTSLLSDAPGILDTGTSLIQIATDAFKKYQQATGGVIDSTTTLLQITSSQFTNLKSMQFTLGSTTFEFTPNAQIWPRNLNTLIGGKSGSIYLIVSDIGSNTGAGLDFICGQTFLERFYSVYDTANNRVGLATTSFTTATTN